MRPATEGIQAIPLPGAPSDGRLVLPVRAEPAPTAEETRSALRAVRSFHRVDPGASGAIAAPADDLIPALLHPFRDATRVRIDYPLFLPAAEIDTDEQSCLPLADLLKRQLEIVASGPDDAKMLKDNITRLERSIRALVTEASGPVQAAPVVETAGLAMIEELGLKSASDEALRQELSRLIGSLPPGGSLLALGEDATLHLFVASARRVGRARRIALNDEVRRAVTTLRDFRRIARSRQGSLSTPEALRDAFGSLGAARFDTAALSEMLGASRSPRTRNDGLDAVVEHALGVLETHLAAGPPPLLTVIGVDAPAGLPSEDVNWQAVELDDVCRAAVATFDAQAASHAELFAALRSVRLLRDGKYDPSRHDQLREAFDWSGFTRDELLALPPVVAIESAPHLAGSGMLDCSRLMLSGRPVEILVRVQPAMNPAADSDPLTGYRFELAYLGISHREVLVHQSSAARPDHLVAGFQRSLDAATGSIHIVTSGLRMDREPARLGAWMHAGAALGGRAHPFIHYDPEAGETWARRLDLSGNPHPETDWPIYELALQDGNDPTSIPLAFTFADFALLEPRLRKHFGVIPDTIAEDELTPLADYLALPAGDDVARIPFVWAADKDGRAHRLVVDRTLVGACRDRLAYWRTLQELAGIRNEHVREAVDRERERLEGAFETERGRLAEAHASEIAQVRRDEAHAVLHRLAQSLLGTDVQALAASVVAPAQPRDDVVAPTASMAPTAATASTAPTASTPPEVAPPSSPEPVTPVPTPAATAEDDDGDDGGEEPWIDSALCTSCNDCIDINAQLFVYNGNKQAVIGDPRGGTFAQLVQAAEKCPAHCIHPGQPLNPDEPGLDALIERARAFKT